MAFTTGSTPFGLFDSDPQFQADADKVVSYVAKRLGQTYVDVELDDPDVYACFEEACFDYSAIVNSYQAKSVLATFLGSPTGTLDHAENKYPNFSMEWARRQAEMYNDLANLNSRKPYYTGSIDLVGGQQTYDMQTLVNPTGSDGQPRRMIIREVFHLNPMSAFRFFGTTSFINFLNNEFKFESYTPETVFYLLPIWEDILRGMQFETSNRVRRSNYSYSLHNNHLSLYPTPVSSTKLWFSYQIADESPLPTDGDPGATSADGVSNLSNIPFGNIEYSKLNSISKRWIWQMTLALCKETLGLIRRKYSQIPIPNSDLSMDGGEMVNDARQEMERLRTELRDLLEDMTYDKLAAKEADKAASLEENLKRVPMLIYVK